MRLATIDDVTTLSLMLFKMYSEVSPTEYSDDITSYVELAKLHLTNDIVILDHRGFFIMRNETLPVNKEPIWNGVSVYVRLEYRNTRALKDYYSYMFEHFKGRIFGFTDVNSLHNKVLLKRNKLLGFVYEINRS